MIIVVLIIVGAGVGSVLQPTLIAIQAHSPQALRAVVISNRNLFRALGGAVGLACSTLVLQTSLRNNLPQGFKYLAASTYTLPDFGSMSDKERDSILDAYLNATRTVFIVMAPIMFLCGVLCIFIKDKGLKRPEEVAPRQGDQELQDHQPTKSAVEKQAFA